MLKLDYGNKNAIDYWKQWEKDKIEIWPSIDELGERAELIRSGTVWEKVDANLKELVKNKITVRPGITVGAWNVERIPEIIKYFVDIGVLNESNKHRQFYINLLEYPSPYHVHVLPPQDRERIITKLNVFVARHNATYKTRIDDLMKHILHELRKPYSYKDATTFVETTRRVDEVRGENLYEVIPEMNSVRDWVERNRPVRPTPRR
jgi:MoaA/NifB/PqqE/SkfB family radical SAM enzyme